MKRIIIVISVVLLLTFVVGWQRTGNCDEKASLPSEIIISSGPAGGVYEIICAACSEILHRELGVNVSVIPGGGVLNIAMIHKGQANMCLTSGAGVTDAWYGKSPVLDEEIRTIRGLITMFPMPFQIWALEEAEINDFTDLTKLRVCCGTPGHSAYKIFHNLMDILEITEEDFARDGGEIVPLSWSEATAALRDRHIDVLMWLTGCPHPAIMDIEITRRLKFISMGDKLVSKYIEAYKGLSPYTIPPGTYKNQTEVAKNMGVFTFFAVHEDLDEELAYHITEALFENREELQLTYAPLSFISKEVSAKSQMVPLHPGAERYWRKIGADMEEPVLVP